MKRKRSQNLRMKVMSIICGASFKAWASCRRVPFPRGDLKTLPNMAFLKTLPTWGPTSSHLISPPRQIHIEQTRCQLQDTSDAATRPRSTKDEKESCGKGCMGSIVADQGTRKRVSSSTQTSHKHPRCCSLL